MVRYTEYGLVSDYLSASCLYIYIDNYLSKLDISKSFSMTKAIVQELQNY